MNHILLKFPYPYLIKLIFTIIILLPVCSHASIKAPLPLDDYFTQTWDTRNGLPHNGINAIAQTNDGYLWIATWEGFARFNGREFKLFTRGSIAGLPDSAIKSLTPTQSGELLVAGARGGLSVRKNREWQPQYSASTMVNHAIFDNKKNIWLALEGKGLVYRDVKNKHDETIIDNLRAFKMQLDTEGSLWVATDKGLYSVKNKTLVSHFDENFGLPNTPVYSLLLTSKNQLIVGTEQGAFIFKNGYFIPLHQDLSHDAITSIIEDKNNDIWLGTQKNGIFRLSDYAIEKLDDSKGLPNNRISSLYQDKEDSIWVGTSSGLFRLREAPFITLTSEQGLAGDYIRSVLAHNDGSLWIGSSKGLSKLSEKKIYSILPTDINSPPASVKSILSLAQGKYGQVLVGTYNSGVYKVVGNSMKPFLNKAQGLPSNEIRSLLFDSKENIWIGTASGLVKITKNGRVTHFNKQTGLPDNFIMALTEDSHGRIWIGTGIGVISYHNGIVQTYRLNEEFNAEYAFGFNAEDDVIWLTTDRGLIQIDLKTNKIKAISRKNGLPVDKLFQVIIDNHDTFWLSSNRGIIKVSREEINKAIDNQNEIINFEIFAEGVGLLSSQANGGSTPAATLHKDGSVWFATAKGVSQVTHQRLQNMAEKQLPVLIEQLIVDNQEYSLTLNKGESQSLSNVKLIAGASRITIHYAGLGFLMSKNIQYQTQLVGFDTSWINKKNQTYNEFTNLAPGEYTFKMRAKYPNGEWQNQNATLTFIIPFHFWQTPLFKLFIIALSLSVLYLFYRYRIVVIQQSEEKLKRLVAKQTVDLQKQTALFAYQAIHDQLTGLPNRRAFDEWCDNDFKEAQEHLSPLSLAIIDIDHFKAVNDTYSHMVGDQVIKILASKLLELLPHCSQQVKLARWGGEEFTLLISSGKEQAMDFCELIRTTIEKNDFSSVAPNLTLTISIGLTDNSSLKEYNQMISHADHALYYSKHNGRNQVRIYQPNDHENNKKITQRITKVTRHKKRD